MCRFRQFQLGRFSPFHQLCPDVSGGSSQIVVDVKGARAPQTAAPIRRPLIRIYGDLRLHFVNLMDRPRTGPVSRCAAVAGPIKTAISRQMGRSRCRFAAAGPPTGRPSFRSSARPVSEMRRLINVPRCSHVALVNFEGNIN